MTKIQNQVAQTTAAVAPKKAMNDLLTKMEGEIKKALAGAISTEKFTRIVMSAVSANPDLANCTQSSFLGAVMTAAQLGLEPNSAIGACYIIPRKNKGEMTAQFQLGYKGMIDLAYRSGDVESISAHIVYANDEFEYEYGINPNLKHVPALSDRGEAIAAYAVVKLKNGGTMFEIDSLANIRDFAIKKSVSFSAGYSSPWKTDFESMALKTMVKRVLKYAPISTDFQRGLSNDETIKNEINADMSEVQDDTIYDADYEEVTREVTNND